MCWAMSRARCTGTRSSATSTHNRGRRCLSSRASPISSCAPAQVQPSAAPSSTGANSATKGAPSPASGRNPWPKGHRGRPTRQRSLPPCRDRRGGPRPTPPLRPGGRHRPSAWSRGRRPPAPAPAPSPRLRRGGGGGGAGHGTTQALAADSPVRKSPVSTGFSKEPQPANANEDRSMLLSPAVASWARHSPMAAECLNPWPEQGDATITRGAEGSRSITKRLSGVTV